MKLLAKVLGRCEPARPSPSLFFLLLPVAIVAQPARAQTLTLPPVKVEAAPRTCVDVEVQGERRPAFDCLNQELKAAAQDASPGADPDGAVKAVTGNGEPNKVGTFSYTGQSIRMGDTFGKSAFPQRPPAPVWSSPLAAGVK